MKMPFQSSRQSSGVSHSLGAFLYRLMPLLDAPRSSSVGAGERGPRVGLGAVCLGRLGLAGACAVGPMVTPARGAGRKERSVSQQTSVFHAAGRLFGRKAAGCSELGCGAPCRVGSWVSPHSRYGSGALCPTELPGKAPGAAVPGLRGKLSCTH